MDDKQIVLRRAKNAVISRDFNLAIRLYKSLLQDDVKNIDYLTTLGNLYMKNNDDEKALPYFQQILTFYPDDFEAMNSMGGIYRRMGKYHESIDILQKALETKINPAQVNYNLGFTYKLMSDYTDAVECFENVIAANPTDVLAYNHLGTIYAAQNDHEKAVATYRRGLQVDPNHPILQFNLAKSLETVHDDTSAIQAYEAALRAKPGWQEAVVAYAKLLLAHRKTKLAGELVQNAIGLHPQDAELYAQMGQILMRQSNFEKAASSFEIANRLISGNAEILKNLAEAFEKLGRKDESVSTIKKAEKINPDDEKIKKAAASIYLTAEKYAEAAEVIRQIGALKKNDCEALDLAGQYSILIGKNDSAEKFASKIRTIDPEYEAYLYSYASRFFQKGDFSSAKENVRKFIDENMKNVPAWLLLGQIDEKLGNPEEALDDFSTAVAFDPNNFLAGKLAKEIGSKIDAEKSAQKTEKSGSDELSGSQEISLDEFGFSENEKSGSPEEKIVPAEEKTAEPAAEISADSTEDLAEELSKENKTDVLKLDDENALFEDSEKTEEEAGLDLLDAETSATDESVEEISLPTTDEIAENAPEKSENDLPAEKLENSENAENIENAENTENAENAAETENLPENKAELDAEPESSVSSVKPENEPENSEKSEAFVDIEKSGDSEKSKDSEEKQDAEETVAPEETEITEKTDCSEKNEVPEEAGSGDEKAETAYENLVGQVSEILPKLTPLLGNNEEAAKFQKEIELFKRLRQFGELLPFEQRAKFLAGRVRLLLDYIIARLSGRPGLLRAASEIRRKHNLPVDSMETAINGSNRPDIVNVLKDMESLTFYLEDKNLSKALIVAAEEVVDKLS